MKQFLGLLFFTFFIFLDGAPAKSRSKPCGYGTAEYVLIIGLDGLGGVYLSNATDTRPGLRSFFEQGSFTTKARSHNPTLSGPNWGAILTGMRPEEIGIAHNKWTPDNGQRRKPYSEGYMPPISGDGIPETMFKAAKKQNKDIKTHASFSWDWIVHLCTNDSVDRIFRGGWDVEKNSRWEGPLICSKEANYTSQTCANITDHRAFNDTLWSIKNIQPNIMFLYLGLSDQVGHDIWFGCPEYYDSLNISDGYIQELFDALEATKTPSGEPMIDKTLVMVTSDHGGYRGHHSFCRYRQNKALYPDSIICASYVMPAVSEIPVLLRGPGIKKNFDMKEKFISNRDLAATALNALGLEKGQYMTGRILEEAYEDDKCPVDSGTTRSYVNISFLIFIILHVCIGPSLNYNYIAFM